MQRGTALAHNPDDGRFYHASDFTSGDRGVIFQSFLPSEFSCDIMNIEKLGENRDFGASAMTFWDRTGAPDEFIIVDRDEFRRLPANGDIANLIVDSNLFVNLK